jgi:hypothetical protein
MNDIYKTPESKLSPEDIIDTTEKDALKKIMREQRFILAPILTFLFTSILFVPIALTAGPFPAWILICPAFAIGMLLKYTCRLVQIKHRIVSSTTLVIVIFLFLQIYDILTTISVATFSFFISFILSNRTLNPDQLKLIFKWKIGKLNIN